MKKKAFQITEVPMLVIVLGIITIVLGVMATILSQVQSSGQLTGSGSRADSNTVTVLNSTSVRFGDVDNKGNVGSCSSLTVFNVSTDITNKFTVSGCYATLTNNSFHNSQAQFNYTFGYTTYSHAYNVTERGMTAQSELAGWQSTWVVIIAAAVVLGIVSAYLFVRFTQ